MLKNLVHSVKFDEKDGKENLSLQIIRLSLKMNAVKMLTQYTTMFVCDRQSITIALSKIADDTTLSTYI